MTRLFVIFNPAARGEKSRRLRQFLESKTNDRVTLAPTAQAGDAQRLAAQAVAEGQETIIAAGGDGTINEVINGIGTSGVPLGILPLGTVNVFAQDLGIPRKVDEAWTVAENGKVRTIDLACAESQGTKRFFMQLAGVGLDARAVRTASWTLKKRIGPLSYVWAGLKTLRQRHAHIEVKVEAMGRSVGGMAVLIGNGQFYGGPFRLFPRARMDDGLLDVCVFKNSGSMDILRYGQGILRGVHTELADVTYFQAAEFVCTAAQGVPFELDGEDAGEVPVRFSVIPSALRVKVPHEKERNHHAG